MLGTKALLASPSAIVSALTPSTWGVAQVTAGAGGSGVLNACTRLLREKWNVPVKEKIVACGYQGCAVLSSDGRVVKLTTDPTEARAADWVKHHPHTMLPKVDEVLDLSKCSPTPHPVWAVVREDVPLDVNETDSGRNKRADDGLWYISGAVAEATKRGRQRCNRRNAKIDRGYAITTDAAAQLVKDSTLTHNDKERVLDFMRWSQLNCAEWDDMSPDNYRRRANGDLVLVDFGVGTRKSGDDGGSDVLLAGLTSKKKSKKRR